MTTNKLTGSLLNNVVSLLQEFEDVFPEEVPFSLPLIRGIKLVPSATLPNQLAYRSIPKKMKEL